MKCPFCQVAIEPNVQCFMIGNDQDGHWEIARFNCPSCKKLVLEMRCGLLSGSGGALASLNQRYFARPQVTVRPPPPMEVPAEFAADYVEAAAVLDLSPKASAALSRRCLQHIIHAKAGIKKANLAQEIDALLNSGTLPSHLTGAIDAVRNIGNFAAHPLKSTASGEILPVEPGEAEWTLDVLDGLFDFYFVQPAVLSKRKAALDAKLAAAGKPPMK